MSASNVFQHLSACAEFATVCLPSTAGLHVYDGGGVHRQSLCPALAADVLVTYICSMCLLPPWCPQIGLCGASKSVQQWTIAFHPVTGSQPGWLPGMTKNSFLPGELQNPVHVTSSVRILLQKTVGGQD